MKILKLHLREILIESIHKLLKDKHAASTEDTFSLEYPPYIKFGHFSSNAAMLLAKKLGKNPKEIASEIKSILEENTFISRNIQKIEIAGPGFLNFYLSPSSFDFFFDEKFSVNSWIKNCFPAKKDVKIHFEFVSANPTGPLNIVSARAASVGDSICRLLKRTGHSVWKEYYVNDHGNQIKLLGRSIAIRYLESKGFNIPLEENIYQGDYIKDVLQKILNSSNDPVEILEHLPKPNAIEEWIEQAGDFFKDHAVKILLEEHKKGLQKFRVEFDNFFSEKTLHDTNKLEETLSLLKDKDMVYQKEGALFFKSTLFHDDKDRVLKKADGLPTYLLADIAYHREKFLKKFTLLYNIWGPDHHGYIKRLQGSMKALGFIKDDDVNKLKILIIQQVNLIQKGKTLVMSKRLGKFYAMDDLIQKIPVDVSRYFFVTRSQSQHLDFDLDLAMDMSTQNPVYYIQYAHARIHSIFKKTGIPIEDHLKISYADVKDWIFKSEREVLMNHILKFTDELFEISSGLEIHRLSNYLYELSFYFTKYYHHKDNKIVSLLTDNNTISKESFRENIEAKFLLYICKLTAQVLKEGLFLLGIQAPTEM